MTCKCYEGICKYLLILLFDIDFKVLGQNGWANFTILKMYSRHPSDLQILKTGLQILANRQNGWANFTILKIYSRQPSDLQILKTGLQILANRFEKIATLRWANFTNVAAVPVLCTGSRCVPCQICYNYTILLQILLICPHSTWETSFQNADDEFYKLKSTNDSPGLQYEIVDKAKLCKSSWTMNTYLDLRYLDNSLDINKSMLKSIKAYDKISNITFISVFRLKKQILELGKEIIVLRQLAEHDKRVKRSFESGSSALHWMFGNADADDVRRYDSTINNMEKDQNKMLRIIHDQVSILRSTISNLNDTSTSFYENKILFDFNMKKVETNLNKFSNELSDAKKEMFDIELVYLIENNMFELEMFITRIQRMISNAHINKVDAFVMTPNQILSEIKSIENILPDDLKMPVKFDLENIHQIFKIMSVELHFINDKLIFSMKIPLCIIDNFNLYHILPIYVPINEYGQFLLMTESRMYLLADEMVTNYFQWPNIKNCIVVANIFVCTFNEMIHNGETDPICVTELLKNSLYLKSGCFAFTAKGVLRTEQSLETSLPVTIPIKLSLLNDYCCNISLSYPKPIHLNEIKNLKFNKDAFNRINLQLDQQDKLIISVIMDKTYDFYFKNVKRKSSVENDIELGYRPCASQ
ncbi:hypothetical protein AGLY_016946, partial [Aphis glycines]